MSSEELLVTDQNVTNMLSLLSSSSNGIKSRSCNSNNTSCDLKELLETAGISKTLFTKYRRSQKGKNFLNLGVVITSDKNPKIQCDNNFLEVIFLL